MHRTTIASAVLLLSLPLRSDATTWYVDAAAAGGAGTNWATAVKSLTTGLNRATTNDEIWVAQGTYYPIPITNRTSRFNLKADVALYGGFTGAETNRQQRDWLAHPTILSGDIGQTGVATDNVYVVVRASNAGGAVLDGFTVSNAHGTEQTNNAHGILIASPITVRNCRIENNTGYDGGGLYNSSTCRVSNCFFLNNTAMHRGGAIRNDGVLQDLANCVFAGNRCDDGQGGESNGGALAAYNNPVTVANCSFAGNSAASFGQAIYLSGSVTGTIFNCILWDVGDYGGGIRPRDDTSPYGFVNLSYCDVRGGWDPLDPLNGAADNIITNDPLFADEMAFDLSLRTNSPCRNSGTPTNAPFTDILGEPRPQGVGVDIGAYEVPESTERHIVSFQSSPSGLQVSADGLTAATPADISLTEGSHVISVASPQTAGGGVRYRFDSWSDGGAQAHAISVTGDTALTVFFTPQYQWNAGIMPIGPGTVSPPSGGWYDSGAVLTGTVASQWGWDTVTWAGTLAGCTIASNRLVVPMDQPRFVTAKLSRSETNLPPGGWKFVATGDGRGTGPTDLINTNINREIVQRTIAEQADLLIYSGDLVYAGGLTAFQAWTNAWAPLYQAGIGVYVGPGNHDLGAGWNQVFGYLPTNGPPGEIGFTYTVEHSNALFISLDQYVMAHRVDQAWLDAVLAANTNLHVFVFSHEPAFAVHHLDCMDDYPTERNTFWRSLIASRCRVYFCGHDHFYDHARIDDNDGNPDNDVHQFVVGTAGAPFYTDPGGYYGVNSPYAPERVYHETQYGYVVGEVVSNTVTLLWMSRTGANTYECDDVFRYTAAPPPSSVSLTVPAGANENDGMLAAKGELVLPAPAVSNVTVTLLSSSPDEVAVTNSLLIASNQTSVVFDLNVMDDSLLNGSRSIVITATANGWSPAHATITVYDNEIATLGLRIPASAREGDGVLDGAGNLSISAPPDKDVAVSLTSDDTSEILVPDSATLPAGQTNTTFDITIIDDGAIDGTKMATITAHVQNWTDGTAGIDVIDNENTNLYLTLPATVDEGAGLLTDAGSVTISGTLVTGVVVTLWSSDPALLQVPATADIGSQETDALFPIQVVDDHLFQTTRTVTIHASAPGFSDAEGTVNVINDDPGTHYVSPAGNPIYPYTNWQTAGTNIQAVLGDVLPGSLLLIAGGTYALTGEVVIAGPTTLRSARTGGIPILNAGGNGRCLRLADSQAVADGLWLTGGSAVTGGGALVESGTLMNCLITGNAAGDFGGGLYGLSGATVENCTIASNSAPAGGGVFFNGGGRIWNSIVFFNAGSNWGYEGAAPDFTRCCATPAPPGAAHVTNDPSFANAAAGDWRLQESSPCIDTGAPLTNIVQDIDGLPRPLDGTGDGTNALDIGACEHLNPLADSDRDLMRDGDELLAGTSPVDPLSNLKIEGLWFDSNAGHPAVFNWKTVTGHLYTVLSATNLDAPLTNPVSPEWTDVEGTGGALVYTNISAAAQQFFRVRVAQP